MTLFLFLKQIIDMLYRYRALDYIMVVWVLLLLFYQTALLRPDLKEHITVTDGIILGLAALLTVNFLRTRSGYQIYFKVISAFLVYFVGRLYYDRIRECGGALAASSYLIVYGSLLERIHRFGFALGSIRNADGGFYFYDTDMAFAMILAMVFIAMFGRNSILKLFTVFIVCPYMVIFSDAGIQVMLMGAVYAVIAIYILELVFGNKRLFDYLLTLVILGLIALVILLYLPVFGVWGEGMPAEFLNGRFLNSTNMLSRYDAWREILEVIDRHGRAEHLFGIGMGAEISVESLYIKIYYALGYAGLLLSVLLIVSVLHSIVKIRDRKTFYLAVIMAVVLLGTGVTINSMESTQMSWFPLLFAGMVVSAAKAGDEQELQEEG